MSLVPAPLGNRRALSTDCQIEGGTAQGLGLALMEEIQPRGGLITNASFTIRLAK